MKRTLAGLSLAFLLASTAFAQSPGPTFDAADVHVHARVSNAVPNMTGGVVRAGRYDLRAATMVDLIRVAYGVEPDYIVGGPNWLERDRFDVVAKTPQSTSQENVKLMLQALLADRFKLVINKDTRPIAGYALVLGKAKHKMTESKGGAFGCQGVPPPTPAPGSTPMQTISCHGVTTEVIATALLRGIAGQYFNGPVVDLTELKGAWDFDIKFTPRVLLARAGSDGVSIFDAVDQQLGLKVEPRNVPAPVFVVASVNQTPTANVPNLASVLPPAPAPEFDVADIKFSPPDTPTMTRLQPGGRIDGQGITMKQLISLAWDINDDELVSGLPKWADETKYSITAKASTAVQGTGAATQADIDDIRLMVRGLLKERFKLATHFEDRPVTAYTLVVDKPRMQKADPANRTGWKEGPAPGAKDLREGNPMLARLVTARNMTMAQFTEDLPRMAGGYLRIPVLDATGLTDAYDFTLNFSPIGLLNGQLGGRGGDAAAGAGGAASDPTGGLSVFDAIDKQLGLKMEKTKRPMPVLVIDHIEEKPADN